MDKGDLVTGIVEVVTDTEEELTYGELLATLALNGELVITIPSEEEARVTIGLKNLKAKQSIKAKEEGLVSMEEVFTFHSSPSTEYQDCINLHITLKRRGVVKIKKMVIPDNTL